MHGEEQEQQEVRQEEEEEQHNDTTTARRTARRTRFTRRARRTRSARGARSATQNNACGQPVTASRFRSATAFSIATDASRCEVKACVRAFFSTAACAEAVNLVSEIAQPKRAKSSTKAAAMTRNPQVKMPAHANNPGWHADLRSRGTVSFEARRCSATVRHQFTVS